MQLVALIANGAIEKLKAGEVRYIPVDVTPDTPDPGATMKAVWRDTGAEAITSAAVTIVGNTMSRLVTIPAPPSAAKSAVIHFVFTYAVGGETLCGIVETTVLA